MNLTQRAEQLEWQFPYCPQPGAWALDGVAYWTNSSAWLNWKAVARIRVGTPRETC